MLSDAVAIRLVEDAEALEARALGQGDTFEEVVLDAVGKEDMRVYAWFAAEAVDDTVLFSRRVVAYDGAGQTLPLPESVKSYYINPEAALAVRLLLSIFAVGKTVTECNALVHDYLYRKRIG